MSDSLNPYSLPESTLHHTPRRTRNRRRFNGVALLTWPFMFFLNMIVPLILGIAIIKGRGYMGLCGGALVLMLSGLLVCYFHESFARRVIVGANVTAISQVFPILQLFAGIFALELAGYFGLIAPTPDLDPDAPTDTGSFDSITTDVGGFAVTLIVGGIIVGAATILGLLISLELPRNWFVVAEEIVLVDEDFEI